MELKVGMKAKCLSHTYEETHILTVGRSYEITEVDAHCAFEIVSDNGFILYCLTEDCAHGEWEITEEE